MPPLMGGVVSSLETKYQKGIELTQKNRLSMVAVGLRKTEIKLLAVQRTSNAIQDDACDEYCEAQAKHE